MTNKNNVPSENETINEIIIVDDVLQSIAAHSVKELDGVSLISSFTDGIMEKIVKKSTNKAIRVEMHDKNVSLEVHISIEHGLKITDVCSILQANIKKDIEEVTDLNVETVNIFVDNLTIKESDNIAADKKNAEEQENQ